LSEFYLCNAKNEISVLEICIFVSLGNLDLQIDLMGSVAQHRFHWKNANHVWHCVLLCIEDLFGFKYKVVIS